MKPYIISPQSLMAALLLAVVLSAQPLTAEAADHTPIQSVFIIPTSPAPYATPISPHSPTLQTSLSITGISRDNHNNYFAIIGNHTYGVGDEGDVKTSEGSIHIRCVEIKPTSVVVEVDGQLHELPFSDNP
jgi:hypothetical protein